MTVLVTGGTGFIGSYVVRGLLEQQREVATLDVAPTGQAVRPVLSAEELGAIKPLVGDVRDAALLYRIVREHGVEQIVHLAHAPDSTGSNPAAEVRVSIEAFMNILEAARTFGVRRVVWASSSAVFGSAAAHVGPVVRDSPHRPRIPYEACKSHNEVIGAYYQRTFDVNSIALRFNYVYGYGRRISADRPSFDGGLFVEPAAGRTGRVPFADGDCLWQYVEDTAGTVLAALAAHDGVHGAFNTCGSEMPVRDVAEIVKRHIPGAEFELLPGVLDFVHQVDDSETQATIGYHQKYDIWAGVERTVQMLAAATKEAKSSMSPKPSACDRSPQR